MIKIKLLTAILLVACYSIGNAQTATNMVVLDTRDVNSPSSDYSREAKFEFKYRYFIGAPGSGTYSGLLTFAPWSDTSGNKVHQLNFDDSELSWRTGSQQGASWDNWNKIIVERVNGNVGIGTDNPQANLHIKYTTGYASLRLESLSTGQNASTQYVSGGLWRWELGTGISSGTNFELYDRVNNKACFVVRPDGFIGIGTTNPAYKLDVLGTIRAKEVLVNLDGGADFVFEKGYKLLPIEHIANYVQENKHLPDIPSANEMVRNGVSMGDMQVKLLQKVEELTLYVIEQQKQINQLKRELKK
jgi:hypothetical protein